MLLVLSTAHHVVAVDGVAFTLMMPGLQADSLPEMLIKAPVAVTVTATVSEAKAGAIGTISRASTIKSTTIPLFI
jgi:hypothetical protein